MENLPWNDFHGMIFTENFPWNSTEYKTVTSKMQDRECQLSGFVIINGDGGCGR